MRKFSVRPTLTLRGREFKGLRGWAGKPTHPPLTDFPVAAYVLGAVFDVIAMFGRHHTWARDFFRAGTFVFIGGAVVSVLAALTGFWDWRRSTEKGTQARRTANTHAWTMMWSVRHPLTGLWPLLNGWPEPYVCRRGLRRICCCHKGTRPFVRGVTTIDDREERS